MPRRKKKTIPKEKMINKNEEIKDEREGMIKTYHPKKGWIWIVKKEDNK